jgi:hypothetical protein
MNWPIFATSAWMLRNDHNYNAATLRGASAAVIANPS